MRKWIFLIVLVLSTFCLSAEELTDKLTNGKLFYENEEYQEAYDILIGIEIKASETMVIIGEICEKLGKYEEALMWYEKAKEADRSNLKAGLSIVKIYMKSPIKNEKKGRQELEKLFRETKDPASKETLKKLLKGTQKGDTTKNRVEAEANMELSYLDNINNGTVKKTIDNIAVPEEMKKKGDVILNTTITAGYKIIDNNKIFIEPIFSANYEMYFQNSDYSKFNLDLTLFTNVKRDKIQWGMPVGAGVLITEGKVEENRYSATISPNIELNKEASVSPRAGVLYRNNYRNDYDSTEINIGVGGDNKLGHGIGGYDIYFAVENSSNSESSNNRYGGGINYKIKVKETSELVLRYNVEAKKFSKGDKKESITNIAGVGWNVKTKIADIKTGYEFTISDNTENIYDYMKNKISLGINKGF